MGGHINDMVSQHWNTPRYILDAVENQFKGRIDLDPCDNEHSITNALHSFKKEDDGLKADWNKVSETLGRKIRVFCNPPFGRSDDGTSIADWVSKCAISFLIGYATMEEIILLVPASTETTFWHDYIWKYANAICFVQGRVKFLLEGEESGASTKGTAIVYYGNHGVDFMHNFQSLGKVVPLKI